MALAAGLAVANVYAIQPLLDLIGRSLAMPPSRLGAAVMLTQLGYAVGLLLLVPLGDMVDRRKLIAGQTALSAVALVACAMAGSAWVLSAALVAVGLLAVTVQTIVAYASALVPEETRGATVGKVTGGVVIGILAARFVSGSIGDTLGWRAFYGISAATCVIAAFVLYRILPRDDAKRTRQSYAAILRSVPLLFLRDGVLRLRAFYAFIIFAAFSMLWTALVLPLTAAPHHLSHMQVGLFGLVGLAGALAAPRAGRLVDRGQGGAVTGAALALLCLSWGAIAALPASLIVLGVGIVVLDLAVQAVHVTNQTIISGRHPSAVGRVIGGYMVFYSLGSATGGAISTVVYAAWGWTGVCIAGAGISLVGLAIWIAARARRNGIMAD